MNHQQAQGRRGAGAARGGALNLLTIITLVNKCILDA
jgi:hypothetical protein